MLIRILFKRGYFALLESIRIFQSLILVIEKSALKENLFLTKNLKKVNFEIILFRDFRSCDKYFHIF